MKKPVFIKKQNAKVVNLGTKIILKYTSSDGQLEVNHMTIHGRHPDNPAHFIFETKVTFMVFILKGKGRISRDDEIIEVEPEDVIEFPTSTRFAAEGDFEYLTFEHPAWFASQASIVDKNNVKIENTTK